MPPYNPADYVDVQTRITQFWQEYPDGAIRTVLASEPGDFKTCRYRAEVYKQRDNPHPDATGYAFEIAGGNMANKTSHEENCETSAIGRALANMGYATSGKDRPSRQEMSKTQNVPVGAATTPPNAPKPPNAGPSTLDREKVLRALHATGKEHGIDHAGLSALLKAKGHESMATAPVTALVELGTALKADPAKLKGWLAKQQELMPTPEQVPDPARHTA